MENNTSEMREIMKNERRETYLDIMPLGAKLSDEEIKTLGFFEVPASIKYHGAYEGGLFDHSLAVTRALVELTEKLNLEWERPESPYLVGMYHDLCKCDNYIKDTESGQYRYNSDMIIPGHGDKSVIMALKSFMLTDEEIACIRWHMGAYEKDTEMWKYYNRAVKEYPNVLYTHMADMIASHIKGV